MPPLGSRKDKTQVAPTTTADASRRLTGRQPRTSTTRPADYYARPFGSFSAASIADQRAQAQNSNQDQPHPPGFFPAIQHFTDAITALPREVMRNMTLLHEVDAKLFAPSQELTRLVDSIEAMPVPPRRSRQPSRQDLLTFTANNSAATSAVGDGSVKNGSQRDMQTGRLSAAATNADDPPPPPAIDPAVDMARRQHFYALRVTIQSILGNLDEKNVCLTEANLTLDRQMDRINSILPHVETEVSEEARLGNMDHWAYDHTRVKKTPAAANPVRRDVAATNSLAAAAATVHEGEIAAARAEPRRDGRKRAPVDSEIDDRMTGSKKYAAGTATGTGTAATAVAVTTANSNKSRKLEDSKALNGVGNATALKRRKVEAPGLERTMSSTGKSMKGQPKATSAVEPKKKKPAPTIPVPVLAKKKSVLAVPSLAIMTDSNRNLPSPVRSPAIVSSPILGPDDAASRRPSSARAKRKSPSPALQKTGDETRVASKPISNEGSVKSNTSRKNSLLSGGQSGKPLANGTDGASAEQQVRNEQSDQRDDANTHAEDAERHDRSRSRHILKQIASFNRSPPLGRKEHDDDGNGNGHVSGNGNGHPSHSNDDDDNVSGEENRGRQPRSARGSRPDTAVGNDPPHQSSAEMGHDRSDPDPITGDATRPAYEQKDATATDATNREHSAEPYDDADEPRYCYCNRPSFGTMIGCDNDDCELQWFHIECVGLTEAPGDNETWFCESCGPKQRRKKA